MIMNRWLLGKCVALLALLVPFFAVSPSMAIEIQQVQSPGGIKAWLVQDSTVPVITFSFAFRGAGSARDPVGKPGLAQMVSGLLDEGAGDMDSLAFQARLEEISARLRFTASVERFRGTLRTLSANRDEAFRLLALAISKPRFDKKPVERIRAQIVTGLKRSLQNPDYIAARAWYKTAYPDHPYGRPSAGTIESITSIRADGLKSFVGRHFYQDALVVAVAGDITPGELAKRLDAVFGALPKSGAKTELAEIVPANAGKTIVVKRNVPQSVVMFGLAGVKRDASDWYAAYVMNRILGGGGFSSRLMEEVREKRGLAYSVYSYLNPFDFSALYMGGVATANARVAETMKVIRNEWRRMAELGVTKKELSGAKTYINGSFPLRLDSTRRIAGMLLSIQLNRLGIDYLNRRASYINAVTIDDVKRVAEKLLKVEAMTVVVVGQPKGIAATP
jgi:zinc protease